MEDGNGIFAISYGLSQGRIFRRVTVPTEWAARSSPFPVILFAIYFSGQREKKLFLNSRRGRAESRSSGRPKFYRKIDGTFSVFAGAARRVYFTVKFILLATGRGVSPTRTRYRRERPAGKVINVPLVSRSMDARSINYFFSFTFLCRLRSRNPGTNPLYRDHP